MSNKESLSNMIKINLINILRLRIYIIYKFTLSLETMLSSISNKR